MVPVELRVDAKSPAEAREKVIGLLAFGKIHVPSHRFTVGKPRRAVQAQP